MELISFGFFAPRLGFYHDDWVLLEMWAQTGRFAPFVKAFFLHGFGIRPLSMLHYWAIFALAGARPLAAHLFLLVGEILAGLLYFLVLRRFLSRDLALAAAAFATAFPSHAATHFWMSTSLQIVAIDLALAGLLAHIAWLESGRRRWLAASMTAYAAALLYYESPAFLPLLLAAGLLARGWTVRETASAMAPLAAPFAAAMAWQRFAFPWMIAAADTKPAAFSPLHFLDVMRAGVGCVSYKIFKLCARTAAPAFRAFGVGLMAAWAAAAAAGTWALTPRERPRSFVPAAWLAAGGFLAANLPYAFARDYVPTFYGVMGRTGALGGLVAGLLAACALAALAPRPALRDGLAALLLGAFTWTNWHTALAWERSWDLQRTILDKAAPRAATLPPEAMVLLDGFPYTINSDLDEVIVFDASWDFSSALRLKTGRGDLRADVVTPRTRFEKDFVTVTIAGKTSRVTPYDNLYVYDYGRDRWHDYPSRTR